MLDIIDQLPQEIIELISSFLEKKDLINTIFVSKGWYDRFHSSIYKEIILDEKGVLLNIFRTLNLPGYLVKGLKLEHIQISDRDIQDIPSIFPQLNHLTLEWTLLCPPYEKEAPALLPFFEQIGPTLRSLTLTSLNQDHVDLWSVLNYCPHLKHLTLLDLNYQHVVTFQFINQLIEACPDLISLKLKSHQIDPTLPALPRPTQLQRLSLASKSGSSRWPLWLPYLAQACPQLEQVQFKYTGLGQERHQPVKLSDDQVRIFANHCRKLRSIRWTNISLTADQSQQMTVLTQPERLEVYEDFFMTRIQPSSISQYLTSITLGQPPQTITTRQVLESLRVCPRLVQLKIQDCFVNPNITFLLTDILECCPRLLTLIVKDVHLSSGVDLIDHPLKTFILKRSSFTSAVIPSLAGCRRLTRLIMAGSVQTDRRDQIKLDLRDHDLQHLTIQGLRTGRYYAGCRIRFFEVNGVWYYMDRFGILPHRVGEKLFFKTFRQLEFAKSFCRLEDGERLRRLVTEEEWKAWDVAPHVEAIGLPAGIVKEDWEPETLYYSGLVQIQCRSVKQLRINEKLIIQPENKNREK